MRSPGRALRQHMIDAPRRTGPKASALPVSHSNILFDALSALPAGVWAELGDDTASGSLGAEFAHAGWHAIRLDADADPADLMASCIDISVTWMAVHDSALARIADWQAGVCRPLVVVTRPVSSAPAGLPEPSWQATLARNGYLFAAEDDEHAYFVRNDQPSLHTTLAQLASKDWRTRLQASLHAHAREVRTAGQARKAVLQAQTQASAARFEVQALQHQLSAVYASSSWKSTIPLRWSMRLARQPRAALRELAVLAVRLLRTLLRPTLSRVLGHPDLRRHLASLERRHPVLAHRLRRLLIAPPSTAQSDAAAMLAEPPPIHPDNMVGPQFKTLLLDELDRSLPPTSN